MEPVNTKEFSRDTHHLIKLNQYKPERTRQTLDHDFSVTVRGIHVDAEKKLMLGPKIYIPNSGKYGDCGIAEKGNMESALAKAQEGKHIDLRLLWASVQFASGMRSFYESKLTAPGIKERLGPVFGSLNDVVNRNSFSACM